MFKIAALAALTALALAIPAGTDSRLTKEVDGRVLSWPIIGSESYTRSCDITRAWEDGSAEAYCAEDGAYMVFDADGDVTTGKLPGWYPAK